MIPPRIIRTVPQSTTDEVEGFWAETRRLHPKWSFVTFRDPIDPARFPMTRHAWDRCTSGAQLAGLVRLESLLTMGGAYLDADMEMYRPLDPLMGVRAFAGWEDPGVVPDAVIAAERGHPAIAAALALALKRIMSSDGDWRTGNGAWSTGPGVTTAIFPGRADVLLLPPGSFFPIHYSDKLKVDWSKVKAQNPWAFGAHRWHASWLPK